MRLGKTPRCTPPKKAMFVFCLTYLPVKQRPRATVSELEAQENSRVSCVLVLGSSFLLKTPLTICWKHYFRYATLHESNNIISIILELISRCTVMSHNQVIGMVFNITIF